MVSQRTRRQDSGDSKTLVKIVADHKKCDSEYQDQSCNTGGVHHSFRLYRSGVPTATCRVNAVGHSTQRVRAGRNARRSKQTPENQ